MAYSSEVSAGDNALASQYNLLRDDLKLANKEQKVNLIKNYPSLELADGALPDWWSAYGTATVTEEDATGESLSSPPNERVLKCVTGSTFQGLTQTWAQADEPALQASDSVLSAGVWVYVVDAGTLTMRLRDTVSGDTASDSTTTTGSWIWLEANNFAVSTGTLQFQFYHSASGATFYIANPVVNIGTVVLPWRPRGLRYVEAFNNAVLNTSPAGSSWYDLDLNSYCGNNGVIAHLFSVLHTGTGEQAFYFRKNGSSRSQDGTTVLGHCESTYTGGALTHLQILDDSQILEWSADTFNPDIVTSLQGYWEWE